MKPSRCPFGMRSAVIGCVRITLQDGIWRVPRRTFSRRFKGRLPIPSGASGVRKPSEETMSLAGQAVHVTGF